MAIITNKVESHIGEVIDIRDHYWLDGMIQQYATVWDMEKHEAKEISYGYYGNDGQNLYGDMDAYIDCSTEVARDIIRTKKRSANKAFEESVIEYKTNIHKGDTGKVVRGRKIPKGTILKVFWVGDKPTYRARNAASWSVYANETERIAGCHDKDGKVVWIKAEYLKNLTPVKSPCAAERKKFIQSYVRRNVKSFIIQAARG